ncbi:MAG: sodium-dependent transporter [Gammaproteobacteria bacterium]|nr:sodium-dependent transporter [Gammaproteobacteria bacterium]
MALSGASGHEASWSSGRTFILAAIGAAVGLGNIWKFPYVVGVSGGGAFVLIYLVCVVFVALPILIGELLIGRRGSHSPPIAMASVATEAGRSSAWSIVGWMGVLVGFLITTYYSVIAGWTLAYIFKALNRFGGAESTTVAAQFDSLQADPLTMTIWHSVFLGLALLIVARGLQGGIEKTVKVLMPTLFVMLLAMIVYAAIAGDFSAGFSFLFNTDFSKIDGPVILTAIGQAFFSIGVAMGLMMAYGAYVPRSVSLTRSAVIIAAADTGVALLAGLMIFPIVFANGLDPASGPGLIFKTLPTAFAGMPGGPVFGALFFLLLAFAAVTSIIAIIEPIVAYAEDKWGMRRRTGCLVFGLLAWLIGLASVLSFNRWRNVEPLGMFDAFAGMTPYALIDYFTANLLMPLGGILIALFVGWRLTPAFLASELSFPKTGLFVAWVWMLRIVAPLAIFAVLFSSLA